MSEIKQESEIKKLIQDQVRLFQPLRTVRAGPFPSHRPPVRGLGPEQRFNTNFFLEDLVSDPEDEDFQADTEELEEASLTEASSADEAESGEDEDFDVQDLDYNDVINYQFQKLKFNAKEAQEDDEEVDSKVNPIFEVFTS